MNPWSNGPNGPNGPIGGAWRNPYAAPPGWQQRGPGQPTASGWSGQPAQQPGWAGAPPVPSGQPAMGSQFPGVRQPPYAQAGQPPTMRFQPGPTPQGPPFYPGQYPPAYPWPKARKSASPLLIGLPLVLLAALVVFFGLLARDWGSSPEPDTSSGGSGSQGQTTDTTGGSGNNDPTYLHEDYKVPRPGSGAGETFDTFDDPKYLTSNSFYEQTVPVPVRCELSKLSNIYDKKQLTEFFRSAAVCLVRVHGPKIAEAGFEPHHPLVTVFTDPVINTPCGEGESTAAFFCPANERIYYGIDFGRSVKADPAGLLFVMAHEYSHDVQARVGISAQKFYESKGKQVEQQKEMMRRSETQADCWAGTFISATKLSLGYGAAELRSIRSLVEQVGDDQLVPPEELPDEHGISTTRLNWLERGFAAKRYGECNSFVAPKDEVK